MSLTKICSPLSRRHYHRRRRILSSLSPCSEASTPTTTSTTSLPFFCRNTRSLFLLSLCLLPCPVLSFKAGHVEPVAGTSVLRNGRPYHYTTTTMATGSASSSTGNLSKRNPNANFPPTGGSGGSRSAILMKLTSPRREFGGHVYQDPSAPSHLSSPINSDLYAFSKSTESQQILPEIDDHDHDNQVHPHSPFVRFPSILSPFSTTQSRETQHYQQRPPPQQRLRPQRNHVKTLTPSPPQDPPHPPHHQKHLSESVSDLLAQHEEPSSLFGAGATRQHGSDFELLDSYYTTGSEDTLLSSVDIDRYSSKEAVSSAVNDLYKKQTATRTTTTVESPSLASSPPPALGKSSKTTTPRDDANAVDGKSKTGSGVESNSVGGGEKTNYQLTSSSPSQLSKPSLLPISNNYLSLATFRHIDNTLEKSSSNILSRIANFWRNRTLISNNTNINNSSSSGTTKNGTVGASSSGSSNRLANSNANPQLASDGSSSVDAYDNDINAQFDNADDYGDVPDDNHNTSVFDTKNDDDNRRGNHHHQPHSSAADSKKKLSSAAAGGSGKGSGKLATNYISVENLDSVALGGTASGAMHSNQYLSLDDDDEEDLRAGEDFVASAGEEGGNTKEHTVEHPTPRSTTATTTTRTNKAGDGGNLSSNEIDEHRHFRRHQQHGSTNSASLEDYLAHSGVDGGDEENWLEGGDSTQSGQSFHDNLFHTTPGTITAVIDNSSSSSSSSGGSKIPREKDLMSGSGSSKIERVQKGDKEVKKPLVTGGPTGSAAKGDVVKRAESDKVWSSIDSHIGRNDLVESAESEEEHDYYNGMTIGGFLKRELWTIPLFVLASLNMVLIILFEVYVLCRARGTSRRHLFLGQMLLFGLFLCSFLALMFAVHPSIIGCFVGRLGVGITYSLIFSVLMVKCVFLLSLDTGVYLPTSYQGILLFFAVAVQVAIDTQWVVIYPPFLQCGTSFVQLLYSLSYVGLLILMVGFLAGRAAYKGVVENYREAVYILITAVVTVPVALSWTVAGWMLQGRHQDACVSFGLVAHSLTTFLIMFMPKGRQLASLDKEAVCFEDQEDQCSGYSPSFFHFKPTTKNYKAALWGGTDGNLYTTLEPTVSTINPNVFFHRNDFHSGMIY